MKFDVYRSSKTETVFVFVESGVNPDQVIPEEYADHLGELNLFKTHKEIKPGDSLIGAPPEEIIANVQENGYSVQGVNIKTDVSEVGAALGGGLLLASLGGGPIGALIGATVGYLIARGSKEDEDVS